MNTITISKKEYEQLLSDSKELQCLNNAINRLWGVDSWEGHEYAMDEFHNKEED